MAVRRKGALLCSVKRPRVFLLCAVTTKTSHDRTVSTELQSENELSVEARRAVVLLIMQDVRKHHICAFNCREINLKYGKPPFLSDTHGDVDMLSHFV